MSTKPGQLHRRGQGKLCAGRRVLLDLGCGSLRAADFHDQRLAVRTRRIRFRRLAHCA